MRKKGKNNMTNNTIIALSVLENNLMTRADLVKAIKETHDIPFHTFNEWRARGYKVKKGSKAVLKARLWVFIKVSEEDKKNGKEDHFIKANSGIFSREQVELTKEEVLIPLNKKTLEELVENNVLRLKKKAEEPKTEAVKTEEPKKAEEPKKTEAVKQETKAVKKTDTKKAKAERTAKAIMKEADKKLAKAEKKTSKKTKAVKTEKKAEPKTEAVKVNAIKPKETPKAKTSKAKKEVTKKASNLNIIKNTENGIEVIRFELTKSDGNKAFAVLTKDFYERMSDIDKLSMYESWGL